MTKPNQEIPKSLLRQIDGYTGGGFVLFYLHKDGTPKMFSNADSVLHSAAIHYFIQNWAKAIETYNIETIVRHIDPMDEDDGYDDSKGTKE